MHKTQKVYVPELIFGQLLTSSNYDDMEKKTVGGKNGYGAKLANIFSNKFMIEICDSKQIYTQVWRSNMKQRDEPKFKPATKKAYTKIRFYPDFTRFSGMSGLDSDIVQLLSRRVIDIAGTTRGISTWLNNTQIKFDSFEKYCDLYLTPDTIRFHHKDKNGRWELCVAPSNDNTFQSVSFVNSINTSKGMYRILYVIVLCVYLTLH